MPRPELLRLALVIALATAPAAVFAQSPEQAAGPQAPATDPAPAVESKPDPGLGLALDLGVSSVYVFRGFNMFQKDSQWNQHAFLAPSLTWTIGQSGFQVGYWGAFQFLGDNVGAAIDAGFGAEQDLIVSYSRPLAGDVSAGLAFTAYLYPAAKESVAGTNCPVYLEPALFVTWPGPVDLGLRLAYYHGVQGAVSAYRYVYFTPTVGKTLPLSERVSLALSASAGFKGFLDTTTPTSKTNRFDVLVSAGLPITLVGTFYVKPSVSWAWTDLDGKSASESMVVFGGVNLGATL